MFADFQILEEAKFIQSRSGGANLMDKAGYIYYKQKVCTPKIHWDCRLRKKLKCKGRATTENFNIISLHGEHNHPAPSEDEIFLGKQNQNQIWASLQLGMQEGQNYLDLQIKQTNNQTY